MKYNITIRPGWLKSFVKYEIIKIENNEFRKFYILYLIPVKKYFIIKQIIALKKLIILNYLTKTIHFKLYCNLNEKKMFK